LWQLSQAICPEQSFAQRDAFRINAVGSLRSDKRSKFGEFRSLLEVRCWPAFRRTGIGGPQPSDVRPSPVIAHGSDQEQYRRRNEHQPWDSVHRNALNI
jgi:hypothetical protein